MRDMHKPISDDVIELEFCYPRIQVFYNPTLLHIITSTKLEIISGYEVIHRN